MKKLKTNLIFAAIVFSSVSIFGQGAINSNHDYSRFAVESEQDKRANEDRFRVVKNDVYRRRGFPTNLRARIIFENRNRDFYSYSEQMYRKAKDKEVRELKPTSQVLNKYRDFLRLKKTGIVTLIPDQGCSDYASVVLVASEHCMKYDFPGAGSSFSFRKNGYRIPHLADLTYDGENLVSRGEFANVVFTILDNHPVDKVFYDSPKIKTLRELAPATSIEEAKLMQARIQKGFTRDGLAHGFGVKIEPDTTYAMRIIAYRGSYLRSSNGVVYNELSFDDRRDLIVTFRIVEGKPGGRITIIYRILKTEKAPELKTPKDD